MNNKPNSRVIRLAGIEWYELELENYKRGLNSIKKQLSPANLIKRIPDHPLITGAVEAGRLIALAEARGNEEIPITSSVQRIHTLEEDIKELEDLVNPDLVRPRLQDEIDFEALAFELHIAAGYSRLGYGIELVDPKNNIDGHTHDIDVKANATKPPVAIECKYRNLSLADKEAKMLINDLQYQIHKEAHKKKRSTGVLLELNKVPSEKEIAFIANRIASVIGAPIAKLQDDLFSARVETFARRSDDFKSSLLADYYKDYDFGTSQVAYGLGEKQGTAKDASLVRTNLNVPEIVENNCKNIVNALNKAARQLPQDRPGLIYMDIAKRSGKNAKGLVDCLEKKLHGLFSQRIHLAAIVITFLDFSDALGNQVIVTLGSKMIENPNPKTPLPERFVVLGSEDMDLADDFRKAFPDEETRAIRRLI